MEGDLSYMLSLGSNFAASPSTNVQAQTLRRPLPSQKTHFEPTPHFWAGVLMPDHSCTWHYVDSRFSRLLALSHRRLRWLLHVQQDYSGDNNQDLSTIVSSIQRADEM